MESLAILDALQQSLMDIDDEIDDQVACAIVLEDARRDSKLFRRRWDSEYLVDLAVKERSFVAEYRVDPGGFDILTELLSQDLSRNETQARNSLSGSGSRPISVESRVGAALIMLSGGRNIEAMRTHGLAMSSVYTNLHEVARAINKHPALEIKCDNDRASLETRAADFQSLSTHKLFEYCTGAIDGLAIRIRAPSKKEVQNQLRFYNGNKKFYSLNLQGVCDAKKRFIAVTCKHAGSTNDIDAFLSSDLVRLCGEQEFPFHWKGDHAYPCSESLMGPYPGVGLHNSWPAKEWFNFWHSQLRITIECTFGIFIQRWGIFWTELKYDLHHIVAIIHACVRLHNFCVNRTLPIMTSHHKPPAGAAVDGDGVLQDKTWRAAGADDTEWTRGGNTLRETLLAEVTAQELRHERSIVRKV